MLAKLTSKNQLTLPKAALDALGSVEYLDVEVRSGQIVLTPVRIQRGDAVRAKLAALGLGEADMADAVAWARSAAAPTAAQPQVPYVTTPAPKRRVSPARKAATPKKPARGR